MRALIQRVKKASVSISGKSISSIGDGMLIFLGITHSDTKGAAGFLADKLAHLRIFNDPDGKMNLSLLDTGKDALVVSQFTLYGDCRKGRRPGFSDSALPEQAVPLYEEFIRSLSGILGKNVPSGHFGADMLVSLDNDGPVTFLVESKTEGAKP